MQTFYPELVRFDFQHDYFNSVEEAFSFQPQGETLRLLQRSGLLFRTTKNGFTVLYQAVKDKDDNLVPLRKLREQMALRFWMYAKSPYTSVVSDLPLFSSTAQTLYFDNLRDRSVGTTLYLNHSAPASTAVDEDDFVELALPSWRYKKASSEPILVRVQDAHGTAVKAQNFQPDQGHVKCLLDLTELGPGLISITPGNEATEKYYQPESLSAAQALQPLQRLAAVDLYAGSGVPGAYSFVDSAGLPQAKTFTCRIASRTSRWRYIVVPRFNTSLNPAQLSIEDADSRFIFGNAIAAQSMNGEAAFAIESTGPIPIRQVPVTGLSLKRNNADLIKELPNPGPDQIMPSGTGFVSEMYLFV